MPSMIASHTGPSRGRRRRSTRRLSRRSSRRCGACSRALPAGLRRRDMAVGELLSDSTMSPSRAAVRRGSAASACPRTSAREDFAAWLHGRSGPSEWRSGRCADLKLVERALPFAIDGEQLEPAVRSLTSSGRARTSPWRRFRSPAGRLPAPLRSLSAKAAPAQCVECGLPRIPRQQGCAAADDAVGASIRDGAHRHRARMRGVPERPATLSYSARSSLGGRGIRAAIVLLRGVDPLDLVGVEE